MIGKALGGSVTHLASEKDPTHSACGSVKGSLRIEISTTRVGCKRCRKITPPNR